MSGLVSESFWGEPGEERFLLERFYHLLLQYPGLPIVTWSGTSAEAPQLSKACRQWDQPELLGEFEGRHVDLWRYVERTVRFPTESHSLKDLAEHLGIASSGSVRDGLDTVDAWRTYQEMRNGSNASELRNQLVTYNSGDVTTLVEAVERLKQIGALD